MKIGGARDDARGVVEDWMVGRVEEENEKVVKELEALLTTQLNTQHKKQIKDELKNSINNVSGEGR